MKNILFILVALISSVFVMLFASCAPDEGMHGQPDGSGPHVSGQVSVTVHSGIGAGQQGAVPTVPAMMPVSTGRVYLSGAYVPSTYWFFDPYLQPTEWYRVVVTIGNADYQVAATNDMVGAMNTYAMSKGFDYVNVSIGTLNADGYSVPQIVSYF